MRGGDEDPTEAYAAYAAGRGRSRQRSRWALFSSLPLAADFADEVRELGYEELFQSQTACVG